MSGFPLFSNFEPHVRNQFDARKGDNLEVSKYTTWFRLFSGAGSGLIMYSNPDYRLFRAAGDGNVATIYGGQSHSGILGVDWNNKPVTTSGTDVPLKPSPVVTSADVDEGMGNISRRANLSITAFTKQQADLLAEYFIEPGFTVFFEWGRNKPEAMKSLIPISGGSQEIATKIAEMQNFGKLVEKRNKSNGHYDNYLGFIKGGNLTISGEVWNITVELVGYNEIPYWMQSRDVVKKGERDEDGNLKKQPEEEVVEPAELFEDVEEGDPFVTKRFKLMFNSLPANRRTKKLKQLKNSTDGVRESDLINFDKEIIDEVNKKAKRGFEARGVSRIEMGITRDVFGADYNRMFNIGDNPTLDNVTIGQVLVDTDGTRWKVNKIDEWRSSKYVNMTVIELGAGVEQEVGAIDIQDGVKVINEERFISMRLAMKILELNAEEIALAKTDNTVKINIDIEKTPINAFKHIYSTDRSKLFIPNAQTPAFTIGVATRAEPLNLNNIGIRTNTVDNSIPQVVTVIPTQPGEGGLVGTDRLDNNRIRFPSNTKLIRNGVTLKKPYEWGYLKNLYINFDFFKKTIDVKTFVLGDVLKTLLNGLSDAVSSYWDFQIFEREDENGNMTLQIYDMEFATTTDVEDENMYEFTLLGDRTIFLDNSFTMDIPGAMANKIIGERLNVNAGSTVDTPGLFTDKNDLVLTNLKTATTSTGGGDSNGTGDEGDDDRKKLSIETYLDNVGIYIKPNIKDKNEITTRSVKTWGRRVIDVVLDDFVIYGSYNDTKLFDAIYYRDKEKRAEANKQSNNEVSTLLPLTFSFTVHGIAGIKRGDKFKVIGLPEVFSRKAFFQVTAIKQVVAENGWRTEVEGRLRRGI